MSEPDTAADYGDRESRAVYSALIELGQVLGAFRGKFVVVGGAVPWLLLREAEPPHVGTLDIDLDLAAMRSAAGATRRSSRRWQERGTNAASKA